MFMTMFSPSEHAWPVSDTPHKHANIHAPQWVLSCAPTSQLLDLQITKETSWNKPPTEPNFVQNNLLSLISAFRKQCHAPHKKQLLDLQITKETYLGISLQQNPIFFKTTYLISAFRKQCCALPYRKLWQLKPNLYWNSKIQSQMQ